MDLNKLKRKSSMKILFLPFIWRKTYRGLDFQESSQNNSRVEKNNRCIDYPLLLFPHPLTLPLPTHTLSFHLRLLTHPLAFLFLFLLTSSASFSSSSRSSFSTTFNYLWIKLKKCKEKSRMKVFTLPFI